MNKIYKKKITLFVKLEKKIFFFQVTPTRSTGGASYIHHEEDGFSTATEVLSSILFFNLKFDALSKNNFFCNFIILFIILFVCCIFYCSFKDFTILQKNRAVSEVASMASRHRRTSVPSFTGGFRRGREGSVDPLLEGFQSDGAESIGFHR